MKTMEERLLDNISAVNAVNSIAFVVLAESGQIDNVTAGEHSAMFEEWKPSIHYMVGHLRRHGEGENEKLYRCIKEHDSQSDWTPDVANSLWVVASDPAEEYPDWSQPIGDFDAYHIGDKVTYDGKKWVCVAVDGAGNNTWPPGVYGWEAV